MGTADLTVLRLRLQAPRAAAGLLHKVEDALRVSSKPAALLNRFVLVRRLRLRAVASASAQTLAMQLERAWQQLAARAQAMETAGDTAEAVWAPSLAVARQMLLRRWLRGEATEAWFWRRIAASAIEAAWPARAVALMLMADEEDVVAITPASMHRQAAQARSLLALIAEQGMAAQFIEAIDDPQALAVLKRVAALHEAPRPAHRRPPSELAKTGAVTPRARLLAFMVATLSPGIESEAVGRRIANSGGSARARVQSSAPVERLGKPAGASPRHRAVAEEEEERAVVPDALAAAAPTVDLSHGLASPWSGLWLLLPLLLRHGLDDAENPLTAWAGTLRAACRRFRVPDDDPLHTALAGLDLPPADDLGWLRTARLAAVADARLPLLRIARRRGAAWVSPERIDIEFPASSLDLRIRRAGFDINPGFIPWLGRIVHLHYPS